MPMSVALRVERREQLLAAADAVVQRHGAAASMQAIAAEAGITKPILYRHFGDKSGLYAALADRHTDRLVADLTAALHGGGSSRERVVRTVRAYLAVLEREPQVYRFLMQSLEAAGVRGRVHTVVVRLQDQLAAGITAELGLPPGDVRAAAWGAAIVGMVQAAGEWWLDAQACTADELAEQLTCLLWGAYVQGGH